MRSPHVLPLIALVTLLGSGCGASYIPNTTVEDNEPNREVVEFVEQYRHAVEQRDVPALLSMASPTYYDDNGTPFGRDDLDFETLRDKLSRWSESVTDCRYEMRYQDVEFRQNQRVYVKYRYTASFRVIGADGEERWVRRLGDNRLVLARDDGSGNYTIISGM